MNILYMDYGINIKNPNALLAGLPFSFRKKIKTRKKSFSLFFSLAHNAG